MPILPRVRLPARHCAACIALLLMPVLSSGAPASSTLDKLLEEENLPGIALVVLHGDVFEAGAEGLADLKTTRLMASDTKVHVGSVTKTVLALGVLRMVEEGLLSLDTNVEQLLPMLNWQNPWQNVAPIRVQHLLEHTAGLDNIRMWQFLNSQVTADTPLAAAFPADQEHLLAVRTRPGGQYSYSNMGYTLLGLVIEQVTGQRYEDYLAQSLLTPLGLLDSTFKLVTQQDDVRLAMGYLDDRVPQAAVPMFLRPAGQFTTTARDMGRLLGFMLGDGDINGEPFIAPALMARLGKPSTTDASRAGLAIGHGLALAGRDRHGAMGYCHPGTTFGFRAYLCLFPEQGKAFFYAINADVETANYERFVQYFIEYLGVSGNTVSTAEAPAQELSAYTGLYTLAPANMAQFAWLDWIFNSVWVSKGSQGSSLVVTSLQQPVRRLLPLGDGLFRDDSRRFASHVFFDDGGTVLSNGLLTYRRASVVALTLAWASLVAGVLGLLYIFLRGTWLLTAGGTGAGNSLLLPWFGLVAFGVPAFLYSRQPFLVFGEITAANITVAVLTGTLPLLLVWALFRSLRSRQYVLPDLLALMAAAQLCLVLLLQGVLPVVFWR